MHTFLTAQFDILPPSSNEIYPTVTLKNGSQRRVLSKKAREWREYAFEVLAYLSQRDHVCLEQVRQHCPPLYLQIFAKLPPSRIERRDEDGYIKLTQDTVMRWIGYDDKRVYDLYVSKRPLGNDDEAAFLVVSVAVLDSEELTDVPGPQHKPTHKLSKSSRRQSKMAG